MPMEYEVHTWCLSIPRKRWIEKASHPAPGATALAMTVSFAIKYGFRGSLWRLRQDRYEYIPEVIAVRALVYVDHASIHQVNTP